jgi:large subunit ribosomal protein L10
MALTKTQKEKIVEELTEDLKQQKSLVFVSVSGLKVKELSALRRKIKEVGGKLKVAKKTLIKLTFEKVKLKTPEDLIGEVALVFGFENEFLPIKRIFEFSKEKENLKILSGIFEGKIINKDEVVAIAELPGREGLLSMLVGSLSAPISNFVNVLQGNIKGLLYALSAIKK